MASNNVTTFLNTIQQGIKPNMFSVDIQFPGGLDGWRMTKQRSYKHSL